MAAKILVVDDNVEFLEMVVALLREEGHDTTGAASAEAALELLRRNTYHVVLSDLQLPGRNGISLVSTVRGACPGTAVVMITGHGSIRSAVTALKRGAVEYITKPIKPRRLLTLIESLLADPPVYLPNKLLTSECEQAQTFDGMHARSRLMRSVFERIHLAAETDTTVLITGESGTGKELVARSIHQRSARAAGPFVALHTGAIPQDLIASELFGHERGAFTGATEQSPGRFEQAEGGTLFLDEISTMDERAQIGLLRVLESFRFTRVGGRKECTANVRVVAASNRDVAAMVQEGKFREDLFFRLNIFPIRLPALRERPEDIPVLAAELACEFAKTYGKDVQVIPAETERLLVQYTWPGNVRELRNVIEQAVLLARGDELSPQLLPQMLHREPPHDEVLKIQIGSSMESIEKEVILHTLAAQHGNKTAAAEVLGISRRSIYNKLAAYGVGPEGETCPSEDVVSAPRSAAAAGGGRA